MYLVELSDSIYVRGHSPFLGPAPILGLGPVGLLLLLSVLWCPLCRGLGSGPMRPLLPSLPSPLAHLPTCQ